MPVTVIQGNLKIQVRKEKWKKRYFTLDSEGYLHWSEKKTSAKKHTIAVTKNTQIAALREGNLEGGLCITGNTHDPLFLQAGSEAVASGWIRAIEIVQSGGTTQNMRTAKTQKEKVKLAKAFANQGSAQDLLEKTSTLERKKGKKKKKGRGNTLDVVEEVEAPPLYSLRMDRPISFNPDLIPPPPPESVASESDVDLSRYSADFGDNNTSLEDGSIMHIDGADYFVDTQSWEYYESHNAYLNGVAPIGRASLDVLV
mmetsp:Transcript_4091/g.7157  ORF Transcript_4091/g.7157 Transcript_4091/m.7157 type:complete len:256 (-) Transcript_4091:131-898(-)|eukprot:CAMPEP_0184516762 /NCGR_PEP_ID=MMETSP0198_2-20121128/5202_1 /TAXON_ID=1112570 /ORGANISM="Thraustochytrium sp., Strain LLF1b" /LENGTH=255 /DNA_ID=CAMNT_0026907105 /DNA_START=222 /DNA_END=989 /DNA_ORIENTATION=+